MLFVGIAMPAKIIAELSALLLVTSTVVLLALTSAPQISGMLRPSATKASPHDWRVLNAQEINRRTMDLAAAMDASEK